jgi:hypothetical protein
MLGAQELFSALAAPSSDAIIHIYIYIHCVNMRDGVGGWRVGEGDCGV